MAHAAPAGAAPPRAEAKEGKGAQELCFCGGSIQDDEHGPGNCGCAYLMHLPCGLRLLTEESSACPNCRREITEFPLGSGFQINALRRRIPASDLAGDAQLAQDLQQAINDQQRIAAQAEQAIAAAAQAAAEELRWRPAAADRRRAGPSAPPPAPAQPAASANYFAPIAGPVVQPARAVYAQPVAASRHVAAAAVPAVAVPAAAAPAAAARPVAGVHQERKERERKEAEPDDSSSSSSSDEELRQPEADRRARRGMRRNGQRARQHSDRLHAGSVVAEVATYERLHLQHHALWRDACRGPFRAYLRAHEEKDDEKRVQAIRNILLLPQQVLVRRRGGRARGPSQLINQLRRAATVQNGGPEPAGPRQVPQLPDNAEDAAGGDDDDGDDDSGEQARTEGRAEADDVENALHRQDNEQKAVPDEERRKLRAVQRASELVSFGLIGKAARSLVSDEPVEVTEEVKQQLEAMHSPMLSPGTALPALPEEGIPMLVVHEARLRATARDYASAGPSKGPSGWTGELVSAIIGDADIIRSFSRLVEDISSGQLPSEAHTMLTACREVPIRKKPGSTRVRPINPAEPLLQIAEKYVLDVEIGKPVLRELFDHTQYAVGVPGGCEVAAHMTRVAMEVNGAGAVCVAPDFTNAFGSVRRQVVMEELLKQPDLRPIWSMAHWLLRRPCALVLQNRRQKVTRVYHHGEGLCQGRVTSPAYFSIATLAVYKAVQEAYPTVTITPFLDDPPLTGTVQEVTSALALLEAKAQTVGLQLNLAKTQILFPAAASSADLPEALRSLTARGASWSQHGIRVLGTNIGPHCDFAQALTQLQEQEVAAQQRLLDAVQHKNLPVPAALHIVRACGVPRLNFVSRTTPPEQAASMLQVCDHSLATAVCERLSLPRAAAGAPETAAMVQMQLPIRLGGLGIRLATKTAPAAFVAAAAACAPYTRPLIERVAVDARAALPYIASLTQAIQTIKTAGQLSDDDMPNTGIEFVEAFSGASSRKMQGMLTKRVELTAAKRLEQSLQVSDRARFVSLRLKESGRFVTMVASTDRNTISDDYFVAAVKLRLGVRHGPDAPTCPGCGSVAYHDTVTHAISCKKLKRTVLLKRHDGIAQALVRICQQNDIPVFVEPRLAADRRKPDLDIVLGQQRFLVDVVVVNPADATHAERSARNAKTELKYREAAKINKYRDIAQEHNAVVVPFACSAFGGLGDAALAFVQRLRDHLRLTEAERKAAQVGETAEEMAAGLLRDIAVAIARANGRACVELATRLASQRGAARRRQRDEGRDGAPSSSDESGSDDDSDSGAAVRDQAPPVAAVVPQPAQAPPGPQAAARSVQAPSRRDQQARHAAAEVRMQAAQPLALPCAPVVNAPQQAIAAADQRQGSQAPSAGGVRAPTASQPATSAASRGAEPAGRRVVSEPADHGGVRAMEVAPAAASLAPTRLGREGPGAPYAAMSNAADNFRKRRDVSHSRRRAVLSDLDPPCELGRPHLVAFEAQIRRARVERLTRARARVA